MENLKEELHQENKNRWLGKADYSCLTCSHSMSTDNNKLICTVDTSNKKVEDSYLCKAWI